MNETVILLQGPHGAREIRANISVRLISLDADRLPGRSAPSRHAVFLLEPGCFVMLKGVYLWNPGPAHLVYCLGSLGKLGYKAPCLGCGGVVPAGTPGPDLELSDDGRFFPPWTSAGNKYGEKG